MTTYTAIPNGDIDPDSPVTTGLVTKLRDNPPAMFEGAAGAPRLQTAGIEDLAVTLAKIAASAINNSKVASGAAIATSKLGTGGNNIPQSSLAANSVGQSEVKTTNQQFENIATTYYIFSGGVYGLSATIDDDSGPLWQDNSGQGGGDDDLHWWSWTGQGGNQDDAYLSYINSSPPYDLGDGEIPLFVDCRIDNNTGDITAMSVAEDPPWAYNGPTNITPDGYEKNGAPFRLMQDMSGYPHTLKQAEILGLTAIQEYFAAFKEAKIIKVPLTQEWKNADKDIVPHSIAVKPGTTRITLDYMNPIMETFLDCRKHDQGGRKMISNIIKNHLIIDNSPSNRKGPKGIMVSNFRLK